IRPLAEALDSAAVRAAFAARDEQDAFTALNTAYLHDGVLIETGANAVIDKPLHLIFLSVAHAPDAVAAHPRIVINAGVNSELRLLESHLGLDNAANFINLVQDISLEAGANVRHLRLIEAGEQEFHIANLQARL